MRSSAVSYTSNTINNNNNSNNSNGNLPLSPGITSHSSPSGSNSPNIGNNMNNTGLNSPINTSNALSNNTSNIGIHGASHSTIGNGVSGMNVNAINHAPLPPNFTSPFLQTASQSAVSTSNTSLPIVYQVTPSSYKREQNSRLSTKPTISVLMKLYIWLCSAFMIVSRFTKKTWQMVYTFISSVLNITQESQLQINSRQLATKKRKTLVLDLDETLVHSTIKANETGFDFQVDVNIEGATYSFYIFKRPHVNYFLEKVSEWFDLVIFTASLRPYAAPVIEKLDTKKLVKAVLYRESCVMRNGHLVKDLAYAGFDVSSTIIIDNSPIAYSLNRENAIPIDHYFGKESNPGDTALLNIIPLLEALRFANDVRPILRPK